MKVHKGKTRIEVPDLMSAKIEVCHSPHSSLPEPGRPADLLLGKLRGALLSVPLPPPGVAVLLPRVQELPGRVGRAGRGPAPEGEPAPGEDAAVGQDGLGPQGEGGQGQDTTDGLALVPTGVSEDDHRVPVSCIPVSWINRACG